MGKVKKCVKPLRYSELCRFDCNKEYVLEISIGEKILSTNDMLSIQCIHKDEKTQMQCPATTTLTIPYCEKHLRTVANLAVKRTQIRDLQSNVRFTFKGLFAQKHH